MITVTLAATVSSSGLAVGVGLVGGGVSPHLPGNPAAAVAAAAAAGAAVPVCLLIPSV